MLIYKGPGPLKLASIISFCVQFSEKRCKVMEYKPAFMEFISVEYGLIELPHFRRLVSLKMEILICLDEKHLIDASFPFWQVVPLQTHDYQDHQRSNRPGKQQHTVVLHGTLRIQYTFQV